MKPIEPGAVCIIKVGCKVSPREQDEIPYLGTFVTVTGAARRGLATCGCVCWSVKGNLPFTNPFAAECVLLRIDDDPDAITEPTEQEVEV